jgi:O-methyltransferase
MVDELLKKYPPASDQLSRGELRVILIELQRTFEQGTTGDVVEFGCYKGATSLYLARMLAQSAGARKLWLYDSFEGLPKKSVEDASSAGEAFQDGALMATKSELQKVFAKHNLLHKNFGPIIVRSWFNAIRDDQLPGVISFAFFDGDFYESIRDSFSKTDQHFSEGAIIIIDDYESEQLPGAARAVDEWRAKNHAKIKSFRVEKSLGIIHLH